MISSNILAIVHTSSLFLKKKCNTFTQSHAMKHSNRVRLPQTNPVAFQLSSHTILSLVLHQLSYKDTLKSLRLLMMQQRLSISHLLLLFDELTTLVAFKLALNYVMINKLISPRDRFAAAKISSLTALSPTVVQIIHFLPCYSENENHFGLKLLNPKVTQTRRNLILCLTHLYLMWYIYNPFPFYYLVIY